MIFREEQYQELFNNMPSGVAVYEARDGGDDFVFKDFNRSAERIEQIRKEDLVGKSLREIFPGVETFGLLAVLKRVWETGEPQHFPIGLYQDERIAGWRDNYIYKLSSGEVVTIYDDVTERKRAELALTASEEQYRRIVETAQEGIWLYDTDWRITFVTRQMADLLGYTIDEILQHSADEYLDPEDREKAKRAFGRRLKGVREKLELRYRRKDGSLVWLQVSSTPILDEQGNVIQVLGMFSDITERKQMEESLHQTQFSVDMAADPILWVGPLGNFFYVNDAAVDSLGYTREELLAMSVADIDPDFPAEVWPDHWEHVKQIGSMTFESRHRKKDGTVYPVEIRTNYWRFGDKEYIFAFVHSLASRKRAEEDRRKLEAQIQHAQKLESLGVLAGGIAHDFNNLLVGILGNVDLAMMELSPLSSARARLDGIKQAGIRASELTKQMLAYSGKGQFSIEALDLNELIEEMGHLLHVSISKKAVLTYHFAANLPAVLGDATQIRQVVMNLITNASEAIAERSGAITVCTGVLYADRNYLTEVYLDEDLPEGYYTYLEVSDTGCGMDEATKAKIFDPFFTTKFTGRGLGLAAVMGIVRGHHGAIKIYSEPGKGTTFKVLFPCSDQSLIIRPMNQPALPLDWEEDRVVLLVDDEETVRNVVKMMLESCGFAVITANDGKDGVETFCAHADRVALVLLDMTMPHMNGEEAFREMRKVRPELPVILTSGYNEQDATNSFQGKGLAGFLQKPFQLDLLLEKIRVALKCEESVISDQVTE
ncbi:MAG: PAS domain-containing hybrid sensor histidine kinase/response regulator [Armatimonadota bacterium]